MTTTNEHLGRIANYELIELIGRGGMGVVYKARQVGLDRVVAVKMISNAQVVSSEDRARFQTEAKAVASLHHPGIVSIHEIGDHQGQPYYSMDFIDGPTLAEVLSDSPIPPREAARLTQQVALAVAHAHANNVLHRDLKPSNILLDGDRCPRIADFGLAKRTQDDGDLTQSGQVLGTPSYMSPEQAAGLHKTVGVRSDVYGVGAILYAAITGVPPFRAASQAELLRCVIEELPLSPRRLNPAVDRDLEAICLKCLEKRSLDRYESATELADDLRRYLQGDPITARRKGMGRELWHWARRPQRAPQAAVIVLIVAAFFALCSAIGLGTLLFKWVPISNPSEAAIIVGLDSLGFALCLPIGIGVLGGKRWLMWGGLLIGCGMTAIVLTLLAIGFDGGGLLPDPFSRLVLYAIFGFVACLIVGVCGIALISNGSRESAVMNHGTAQTVESKSDLGTTIDMRGPRVQ